MSRTGEGPESLTERLEERVRSLRHERGDMVPIADIGSIVEALLGSLHGDLTPQDLRVYGELEALARYIYRAKEEISQIRPQDISNEQIPMASDELDAIGAHLEEATGTILDACEQVEELSEKVDGEVGDKLAEAVTRIYEACNFQDVSGQRISKIISTLGAIEERIELLLRAFGHRGDETARKAGDDPQKASAPADDRSEDEKLLNGPQLEGVANTQQDIDALFASLE